MLVKQQHLRNLYKHLVGFSKCISLESNSNNDTAVNPRKQMAKSRFEYVKQFENDVQLLANCWIVVRVDGKAFHKFSRVHDFRKPNDERSLGLMSCAAAAVMQEFRDVSLAFGASDEYSFVLRRDTRLYNRRQQKLVSCIGSLFTAAYVYHWPRYFEADRALQYPPAFDARVVLYPSDANLRDYLSWRQADVHVNNLYNTAFWHLVDKAGLNTHEAEKRLAGTVAADKNELLFSQFGVNYNAEPAMHRKGTVLLRKRIQYGVNQTQQVIFPFHTDLIKDAFWEENPHLLAPGKQEAVEKPFDWTIHYSVLPKLVLEQFKQQ